MTSYGEIYELFLAVVQDYKIDLLYASSTPTMEEYLKPFLIRAIAKFSNECNQDLTDRNDTTRTFNIILTDHEKVIDT
jgi:hypothetical protein